MNQCNVAMILAKPRRRKFQAPQGFLASLREARDLHAEAFFSARSFAFNISP